MVLAGLHVFKPVEQGGEQAAEQAGGYDCLGDEKQGKGVISSHDIALGLAGLRRIRPTSLGRAGMLRGQSGAVIEWLPYR